MKKFSEVMLIEYFPDYLEVPPFPLPSPMRRGVGGEVRFRGRFGF
jgi:hypothetical protein